MHAVNTIRELLRRLAPATRTLGLRLRALAVQGRKAGRWALSRAAQGWQQLRGRAQQTVQPRLLDTGRWLRRQYRTLTEKCRDLLVRGLHRARKGAQQLQQRWQGLWTALRLWGRSRWQALRRWLSVYGPLLQQRSEQYAALIRLDKPIGWLLLLWPCLWALWIAAEGLPDLQVLAVFLCGVFLMRSAGVALNDIADRHFDSQVQRTRNRPLATGAITPLEALVVAMVLLFCAFLLAALFLNTLTLLLAMIALLLAATYPFMKRFTWLPQLYLGLAFAWGIPMAFAAQTGQVPVVAWALLVASILWTASYDTIYALMDREDDQRIGVKSTAILLADADLVFITAMLLLFNAALLAIAYTLQLGSWFYLAWLCALGNNVYQLWLIRKREPAHCMRAFSSNNYCGMIIFIGIALHYGIPPG